MTSAAFENTQTTTVNGSTLAYCEQGGGEAVVFVHGGISDLRTWERQLPSIGASYRAIAYSRRYARPNEDIDPGMLDGLMSHADDLAAFLQSIDAAPAHLVGNSWGAYISLLAAIRYPEVVRSLMLEEPPVVPLLGMSSQPRPLEMLLFLVRHPSFALAIAKSGGREMRLVEKSFRQGDDETALQAFFCTVVGQESYKRLSESRIQQARENVNALRALILGEGFPPLSEQELRDVRVPTLLIRGEQSPPIARLLADLLEGLLPKVKQVVIPDASHLMHEDNPSEVNKAIVGFLRQHHESPAPTPVA